jgi:hypothetical protein
MIDPRDLGLSRSGQTGDHQRRGCTQIGGHHRSAAEFVPPYASNHGPRSFNGDIRAKPFQFGHMHEPVLKNGFMDDGSSVALHHQGHELGLEVGGKSRIREGGDIDAVQTAKAFAVNLGAGDRQPVAHLFDIDTAQQ